jgi:hypothetical protein
LKTAALEEFVFGIAWKQDDTHTGGTLQLGAILEGTCTMPRNLILELVTIFSRVINVVLQMLFLVRFQLPHSLIFSGATVGVCELAPRLRTVF